MTPPLKTVNSHRAGCDNESPQRHLRAGALSSFNPTSSLASQVASALIAMHHSAHGFLFSVRSHSALIMSST